MSAMLTRLLGLETEYAIRFSPHDERERPSHDVIYGSIANALSRLVATRPGERRQGRRQIFVENGGAFYYEMLPHAPDDGLIEGSTPECRGPGQLLLYQRAQERLLIDALPLANEQLASQGISGTVGLLKNCRDAAGHTYGAQENYEVKLAEGAQLFLYRVGLVLLLPLVLATSMLLWVAVASIVVGLVLFYALSLVGMLVPGLRARLSPVFDVKTRNAPVMRRVGRVTFWVEHSLSAPLFVLYSALFRGFAFSRRRRDVLTSFLASRSILSGAGTLLDESTFCLSEKAPLLNGLVRTTAHPGQHVVFDIGNLMKDLMGPLTLSFRPLARLFSSRQRMQLGFSDSNMSELAEYLKVGTTLLVLDMLEAGACGKAPILERPLDAVRAIAHDPTLSAKVGVREGPPMTAMELQRYFLGEAKAFVQASSPLSIEASEIVRLWQQALDGLEKDARSLIGGLDWVTKRFLITEAARGESFETKKKIDLRYHELADGYFAEMEREGLTTCLLDPVEVERAKTRPPDDTPARLRSQMIRQLANTDARVAVSWDSIKIGGPMKGRVIRLDDYRGL